MSEWDIEKVRSLADIVTAKDLIDVGIYRNHYEAYLDRQAQRGPKFSKDKGGRIFYSRQDLMEFTTGNKLLENKRNFFMNTNVLFCIISMAVTIASIIFCLVLCSCTLSFQIIDTHGTASDVVDDTQSPRNDISPTLEIPVKP